MSWSNALIFVEASYDFIPKDKLVVDGAFFTRRTKVDKDVDFSGFNLGGGLSINW